MAASNPGIIRSEPSIKLTFSPFPPSNPSPPKEPEKEILTMSFGRASRLTTDQV